MLYEMARATLCVGLPILALVLSVLWMSVWSEPSFGSIAMLIASFVFFCLWCHNVVGHLEGLFVCAAVLPGEAVIAVCVDKGAVRHKMYASEGELAALGMASLRSMRLERLHHLACERDLSAWDLRNGFWEHETFPIDVLSALDPAARPDNAVATFMPDTLCQNEF